ncbi:MAG: DUF5623 domain-containing protein [Undibacterium sp.]|nr:DUF5623 domain-containing protein [Undibacterium sp.]
MSGNSLRPTTIVGIKSLAKSFKRSQSIPHSQALDLAANHAGFQNFRHARNKLLADPVQKAVQGNYPISISVDWRDRGTRQFGSETLTVVLTAPLDSIAPIAKFNSAIGLYDWYAESLNRIYKVSIADKQESARQKACELAARLQFMAATKLLPSTGYARFLPALNKGDRVIPGLDHYSPWYDRTTKRYLLIDEPYVDSAGQSRDQSARDLWAENSGFEIIKPEWPGMYNPGGGTRIFLISNTKKGIPLSGIVSALDKLPSPISVDTWNGVSGPYSQSQGLSLRRSRKKDHSMPARIGKMPITAHAKIAELLASVNSETSHRYVVYSRLLTLKEQLDNWAYTEHRTSEEASSKLLSLYHNQYGLTVTRSLPEKRRQKHVESLLKVKAILAKHYPDCEPLRKQMKLLDAAIKSLQIWTS